MGELLLAFLELAVGIGILAFAIEFWSTVAPSHGESPGAGFGALFGLALFPWAVLGFCLPGGLLMARIRWTQFLAVLGTVPIVAIAFLLLVDRLIG